MVKENSSINNEYHPLKDKANIKKGYGELEQLSMEYLLLQRLHFEQTPLAAIEWDISFRVTRWNPSAERIFGYPEEEALGKNGIELLVQDSAKKRIEEIWSDLLLTKEGIKSTNRNTRKDGKLILCDWYNTPLIDESGNLMGVSSLVDDITEREKSQKIQKALYHISQLVHTIDDIDQLYKEIHEIVKGLMKADNFYIALYDEKTDMISFPYFVDEYDNPPEPCRLGRGLTDHVLRTGQNMLVDAELDLQLRKEGVTDLIGPPTEIWLGVTLLVKNKPIGVIVVQDYNDKTTYGEEEKQILTYVSEQIASAIRKKMDEDELKKYSEELKELNASKDKFFSIIAHDLRSPFHGLLGLTNILKDEFGNLSGEEIFAYINEVHSSTANLYSLIENLLDWSRMQSGKLSYEPKRINIKLLVKNIESVLKYGANLKSITIYNMIDEKSSWVIADEEMMRSLFHNLLSNSIKFTPNGGRIDLTSKFVDDNLIEFSVYDSGVGISEESIMKLFKTEGFYTTPGTNKEKGTGLGLLLCKEILEKHGSDLMVESSPGKGAKFYFGLKAYK